MATALALASTMATAVLLAALIGNAHDPAAAPSSPTPPPATGEQHHQQHGYQCDAFRRARLIARDCVLSGGLTDLCCQEVLEAVQQGGPTCLCRIADKPDLLFSGYNGGDIVDWYSECGGGLAVDQCEP